jgi:hypothetical protein
VSNTELPDHAQTRCDGVHAAACRNEQRGEKDTGKRIGETGSRIDYYIFLSYCLVVNCFLPLCSLVVLPYVFQSTSAYTSGFEPPPKSSKGSNLYTWHLLTEATQRKSEGNS